MGSKKYYPYITGLKGISCIFIMLGHFLGIYKYSQQFCPGIPVLDTILNSHISFILSEGYWLYLFFFLSGYLVSKTQVKTVSEVIVKSLCRFFRFAFPVFFAYLVIYLIYRIIGFYNMHTANLFQCSWFQDYYSVRYTPKQVLCGPTDVLLFGKSVLNGPYWVLREMFISSVLIYILKYYYFACSKKHEAMSFSALVMITISFAVVSPVITACLIGMLISICEDVEGILNKPYFAFWVIVVAMLQYAFRDIFNLFFICLIVFVPKVKFVDNILSSRPLCFLGKISWGIYSFHWPLICSAGALLIIRLQAQTGLINSYAIACVLTGIITLIASVIFYFSFERLSFLFSAAMEQHLTQVAAWLTASKNR